MPWSGWFKNTICADLHLAAAVNKKVVDSGIVVAGLRDDFDKEPRPMGRGVDVGADEWTVNLNSSVATWLQLLLE